VGAGALTAGDKIFARYDISWDFVEGLQLANGGGAMAGARALEGRRSCPRILRFQIPRAISESHLAKLSPHCLSFRVRGALSLRFSV